MSVTLGYIAFAQGDTERYNIQVVNVFPGSIEATQGWNNVKTLTNQNLDRFALYQEFNPINSASFELEAVPISQVIENRSDSTDGEATTLPLTADLVQSTTTTTGTSSPDAQISDDETRTPPADNTSETQLPSSETTSTTTPDSQAADEVVVPQNSAPDADNSATTTAFQKVRGAFTFLFAGVNELLPFANESTTTPLQKDGKNEVLEPSATTTNETGDSHTDPASTTPLVAAATSSRNSATTSEDGAPVPPVPEASLLTDSVVASSAPATTSSAPAKLEESTKPPVSDGTVTPPSEVASDDESVVSDACGDECADHRITLSKFGLPLFTDGTQLDGLQLKISFAAQMKPTRTEVQWLKSRYSLDGGTTWETGGEILIQGEISNSTNGGFFILPLPRITDPAVLDSLQVELIYDNDPRGLESFFIDSVWLEMFTVSPPENVTTSLTEEMLDTGYESEPLSGDRLTLPGGEIIDFDFTDDNSNETLIIKSDRKTYAGLSKTTSYVSVTNTSDKADEFVLQSYFPRDLGDVESIEVWNQNKPHETIVPEYQPFVYHCDAGWELLSGPVPDDLEDLSKRLSPGKLIESFEATQTDGADQVISGGVSTTTKAVPPSAPTATTTVPNEVSSDSGTENTPATSSDTGFMPVATGTPFLQGVIDTTLASSSKTKAEDVEEEAATPNYLCRNTSIVQTCDAITGGNTECRQENVKVREHPVTKYRGGWESVAVSAGERSDDRSFMRKMTHFLGFGPEQKPVPERFEVESHVEDRVTIRPGETRYFKVDIAFEPFSSGEFWFEAIGLREYGLLDPFWSSQWQYRLPIAIDNTASSNTLEEYQVFLELDSSLTDFWSNVNSDGSDIRLVQETTAGNEEDWYGTGWESRTPITIQASQVDENLTEFPVYVDLADLGSGFFSAVQDDGDDIRITTSDGQTELAYELVSIDTTGQSGELHFLADSISSSTDTTFYVYHDNPNVSGHGPADTYGSENVWNSDHIAVFHLEEEASGRGTANLYQDSTSNDFDADDQLISTGKLGQLGQGQEVNAQGDFNEYILLPSDIVTGESELYFSKWFNSTESNDQALINGGPNNEYLIFLTSSTSLTLYDDGGTDTIGLSRDVLDGEWHHIVVTRDTNNNEWRVFVDGQDEGTASETMSPLVTPPDCLVMGTEQDDPCLLSTSNTQHLNAFVDEVRFKNTIPSNGFITATYRNQATTTDFYTIGSAETFMVTTFSELDHWVQHFDNTSDEADIWVQVQSLVANASTTIYLYYGNTGAISASSEEDTFSYSTTTELFYVVDGNSTGAISVYSLVDGNAVALDGGTPVLLDEGETTSFSGYASSSVISARGPISATIDDDQADSLSPIGFASTTHAVPTNRNTSQYFIHSPFGTANVSTFIGASGVPDESFIIATGTTVVSNTDAGVGDGVIIESDVPVLVYHQESSRDSIVAYPPTTRDLFGVDSNNTLVTTLVDNPDPDVYCSSGQTGTTTGVTRGAAQGENSCTDGNDGTGPAVRFTGAQSPIAVIQQADNDGSESTAFWPQHEFGTQYFMTTDAAYAAVVCSPRFGTSTVEVQTNGGTTVQSATCAPSGALPGKAYFDNGQGGSNLAFSAGHQIVSTNGVPFYVMYEDDEEDNDETNILGSVQARKYDGGDEKSYSFGAQEINIDAEYEQYSFAWYENVNAFTPTTTWSLGEGNTVGEGESISGQGAVNGGDVLRLRMSLRANVATGSASSTAFALQYAAAETCSTGSAWQEIGRVGSTTAAFSGFNNAAVDDGSTLPSFVLASSTVFGTYEEASLSAFIPNDIGQGEVAEWDWVITNSNAENNTAYCFRMVRSSGDVLVTYSSYPQLITTGPPGEATLFKRFDNEHTSSTRPTLEFAASDLSGDDLHYQIQIATGTDFNAGTVLDQDSQTNFLQFENVAVPADKAPFNSGQLIRYTPSIDLTSSTTYWWRVRSNDPGGSNTDSEWSDPDSFTINESITVSEWYQTTDEQFETNSLISAISSGSDSVELDVGSNLVGEYGSQEVPNNATTTVTLNNTYADPVVVASLRYPRSVPDGDQVAPRVISKSATEFDIITRNYDGSATGSSTLDYMVVEAGEYIMDNGGSGVRIFATSTVVSSYIPGAGGDPTTDVITFPSSFGNNPLTLALVTSNNDPDWIVAQVYSGSSDSNPPSANTVKAYLSDNRLDDGHTASEDVDIIAIELDNGNVNGTVDGTDFTVETSGGTNVTDAPLSISFTPAFASAPGTVLAQKLTNTGGDGGYAMLDTDNPVTASDVNVTIDEGEDTTTDRSHGSAEEVAVIAFADSSGNLLQSADGQITSTPIDFDDAEVGNAWGGVAFNSSGDVTVHIEYQTGSGFIDIPDSVLPGNSAGFTSSPINILNLDTDVYNEIRLVATLAGVSPELFDWRVTWGQRVNIPDLGDPFNNEKIPTTTPTFDFTTTDPQGDDLVYEISWSIDNTFTTGSTTRISTISTDFASGSPYASGDTVTFTIPPADALTDGETYWWRVRAIDPAGDNSFSPWSEPDSFTVGTATVVSTWFQTSAEQFQRGTLSGLSASTTADSVTNDSTIGEYGTVVVDNGSSTVVATQRSYNDPVVVTSVRYARSGADGTQRVSRVLDKTSTSFTVLADNYDGSVTGTTTVDYLVIETGDWTIEDGGSGTRIVADTIDVSVTAGNDVGDDPGGTAVTFSPAFSGSAPAVITNVSSNNDSSWVFSSIYDGTDTTLPPTTAGFTAFMNRNFATPATHGPEAVDYIAIGQSSGTNNSSEFQSVVTGDVVGVSPETITFSPVFSSAPQVTLVQMMTQDGGNGGYVLVDTDNPATTNDVTIVVDEDGPGNSRSGHNAEVAGILAFENASGLLTRENTDGVITSSPVLFSDGLGPKFERYLFNVTTPGNSTTTFQVQYRTATGSWALIPDTNISGNSTGTTTSPVNLTNVDVSTYDVIRLVGTLVCDGTTCPTLNDWSVEWSEGVPLTGTVREYDRTTAVTSGTVRVAVNGIPGNTGTIQGDGTFSISNVTAFAGQTVTVWVDGAADADEAVALFVYDGVGDMTGIELFERHLSFSSSENSTTTNAQLAVYDNSVSGNEDIFFNVDPFNDLEVCATTGCADANLYIGSGESYVPDVSGSGNVSTHDFINDGSFELDSNTMRVSGSWSDRATTDLVGSTVIFTATGTSETIADTDNLLTFDTLTFGETSGSATWKTADPLDVNSTLSVDYGTLDRSSSTIAVAGDLTTGTNGFWSGVATTTFDGTTAAQWSDSNPFTQNIGFVVIDGGAKTVTLQSDVRAARVSIGADDTLNAGGANTLAIAGNFTNANVFSALTGTVAIVGTSTNAVIDTGGSSLFNLQASTTGGGNVSFVEPTVTLLGDLIIATGTVTLPTDTISIGGSFTVSDGFFAHNNGTARFTGGGSKTIQLNGSQFLNSLYNISFTGSGNWAFLDSSATTTNTFTISNGNVTLPSGQLTVARDFMTNAPGSFDANNGEVVLLTRSTDVVTTNGAAFNDLRIREGSPVRGGSYPAQWLYRDVITIDSSAIDEDFTDFPVYLDLADFGSDFFNLVASDGGDIRITEADGVTEVPREVVDVDTSGDTGEVYFLAPSLSSTTNSTFYVYYGNATATDYAIDDPYGAENVWNDDYEAVYHLQETGSTYLDSTSNSVDGAGEGAGPPTAVSGKIGNAQSITAGRIDIGTALTPAINANSEMTISTWVNQNTSSGDQALVAQFTGAGDLLFWADANGANPGFCNYMGDYMPSDCQDVDAQNPGVWQNVVARYDGTNGGVQVNGSLIGAGMTAGTYSLDPTLRWSIGTAHGNDTARQFNGLMDEVRISSIDRGEAWITTEFRNMATTSDFYTVTSGAVSPVRIMSDANVTATGDFVVESGVVQLPSTNFNVGGSFANDDTFLPGTGAVTMNATTSGHTVSASTTSFYTLNFDGVGGSWTIDENATATNAINLTEGNSLTVDSGVVLESTGAFFNELDNASTTWDAGSVLRLSGGTDFAINDKTNDGDSYETLTVTGDGDIRMWNSTASTYDTQDTSSIYSQDHVGVNGDLYIFGDYVRESGTEYWSYETDFDGADLGTTSARQVNVRMASGASVSASSSALEIVGSSTASTTVDAQSGSFTLSARAATVTAQYFTMTGTDADGLQLLSSTTVALLDNAEFTIPGGSVAVRVDASTVDTNPAAQFFGTDFVTGGGTVNVALSGSPASFWWFRDGSGDRYGEANDDDPAGVAGDPGPIRWDDSSYLITVAGTVYADDGSITMPGTTCDGSDIVTIVVDGGAFSSSTPCNLLDGSYSFPEVPYVGDPNIIVYLDTDGGEYGAVITKTATADILDLDIYANRVITRHEDVVPLAIADMTSYDNDDDSDIKFTAATGTPDTLIVLPDSELYVFASTTFTPGGTVTLQSGGTGASYDGTLHVGPGATFTGAGTTTYQIGGSVILESGSNLLTASSTVTLTATTTGKTITGPGVIAFNDLRFTGVGGGWNLNTDITVAADLEVATGTLTGTNDITLSNGSFFGDGLVSLGGGTTIIERSNTLGGAQGWTFSNLTLGNGSVVGTTTPGSSATTTVSGVLTISNAHFLDAGSSAWNLTGSGTVLVESGTFFEGTSAVRFGGVSGNTVPATDFYNLVIEASGGTPTYIADGPGIQIFNDLRIGGAAPSTFTLTTNDPLIAVSGDVSISGNGTLIASASSDLTVGGSWDNDGTFTNTGGLIDFTSTDAYTIAAGNSDFADVAITGSGAVNIIENATSSGVFTISSSSDFTLDPGTTLAVGTQLANLASGGATDWTGSTLYLYGGEYTVNASTTSDTYGTLVIGSGAQIRTWNSTAATTTTAVGGGLYSQDHANNSGDLYLFGDVLMSTQNDHWSYATDFDGMPLSALAERPVNVRIASGGSVTYSGGSLSIIGTSTASTTIAVQGSGDYAFNISGGTFEAEYYAFSDLDSDGVTLTGSPDIPSLNFGVWTLDTDGDAALTVDGTVVNQNAGRNIINNRFATTSGVTSAVNVRFTGSAVSSWRYNAHYGDIDGEDFDDDGGDPGEIVWDNSTSSFSISGTVYQSDATTPSLACGGTANILITINDIVTASTTCNGSGFYQFDDLNYDSNDTLTVFINDASQKAVTIAAEPLASIGNLDLYEDHVIVRHESSNPIDIANLTEFDDSNDNDILFTATDASPDTLVLESDVKLVVWDSKTFAPNGNITTGGGANDAFDGTIELQDGAELVFASGENHSLGGDLLMNTGSVFDPDQSTTTFTSSGSGRTIDTNEGGFYNLIINGAGSFTSADAVLPIDNDLTLSLGSLALPTATTTITGSLMTTSGSFDANGGVVAFDGAGTHTITAAGSAFNTLRFIGSGSWSMNDTTATATGAVNVESGSLTLPSGQFVVAGDFINDGTLAHNTGTLVLATSSSAVLQASSSDLFGVTFRDGGSYTVTDSSLSVLDDLNITGGASVALATTSIGGSFDASGGTFTATGTMHFNSNDTGETIDPGTSSFEHVLFGSASGGWTITSDATTTGNFTISSAQSFTQQSGTTLTVGGVFQNSVGGAATTWTDTVLNLTSGTDFSLNTKSAGGDEYGEFVIAPSMNLSMWDSSAATTTLSDYTSSSLYSKDHNATDGFLYIYGTLVHATGTLYWNYANDFDGAVLTGINQRDVDVFFVDSATSSLSMSSGGLQIIGTAGATTTVQALGAGTYGMSISNGTLNASYYSFRNLDGSGLALTGTPTITSLSDGDFQVAVNGGTAITLATSTLNANPSKFIDRVRFATTSSIAAFNVSLAATTSNAWNFRSHTGNLSGEDYDVDGGADKCGSIRWDDSDCLLTEQTHYRWRLDDGGLGVPDSEWFDTDWDKRTRVRISNRDAATYATTSVKVTITYTDFTGMQADFEDLRFTDTDGVTPLDFWVEDFTPSSAADVWVEVFNLPANGTRDIFMYYDNVSATSSASSTATFVAIDDFEDNDIAEYSGADTVKFQPSLAHAFGGTYGLEPVTDTDFTNDGIARFDQTVAQGQVLRYMQYVDTSSGASDEACTLFGVQSPVGGNQNYAVCLEQFLFDRISLVRDAERNDSFGSVVPLATSTVSYSTGWYEVEIDWRTDDTIFVTLYDSGRNMVATTSEVDSTYTAGGYGFTYWGQHGGWDSFTARYRTDTTPTVEFGAEQARGGASWAGALDTPATAFEIGDIARLRIAIENSGLDITNQQFRLEFATKGVAPTCAAVDASDFTAVPVDAACGSSALCMATSSSYSNGADTTDLLLDTVGTFTTGRAVEDPSNTTSGIDIDQDSYTELEYALKMTVNALSSSYCLRLTDAGAAFDSYLSVPELSVSFNPSITAWSLNGGSPIVLNPGGTTTIFATGTVSDLNGFSDLAGATSTVFRSMVGETCSPDLNNCYRTTTNGSCGYSDCSGNTCTLSCSADVVYFAEPTDIGTFAGQSWRAYIEVEDQSGATSTAFAPSVDLFTINAIELEESANTINYGSLEPLTNTGAYNATTTVENIGNGTIDVQVDGENLTDGGSSEIDVSNQRFASSTFVYSSCGFCGTLSTSTSPLGVNLGKPVSTSTAVTTNVYWGIQIPFGINAAPHQGITTFYAVTN